MAKIRIKGYKVKSYLRTSPKDSRKKVKGRYVKTAMGKKEFIPSGRKFYVVGRRTRLQDTENAIRDMFLSRHYNKTVPVKDINFILKSPKWAKSYGKANVKKAVRGFIKEKYIIKKGKNYIWQ